MQAPGLVDLGHRSFIMIKFSRTVPHAINSQNFVKYMQCSAVVISGAFESNHIADISLQSFQPRELTNQNATFSFITF